LDFFGQANPRFHRGLLSAAPPALGQAGFESHANGRKRFESASGKRSHVNILEFFNNLDIRIILTTTSFHSTFTANERTGMNKNLEIETWSELTAVKTDVLKLIQSLAKEANEGRLISTNDWLRSAVNLEKRYEVLASEAREVIRRGREVLQPIAPTHSGNSKLTREEFPEDELEANASGDDSGGKARGRECRGAYLRRESERGKPLKRVRGQQLFRNAEGVIVGIAYGGEKRKRKDTWFLGLPANEFNAAVLICECLSGKCEVFNLPSNFIERNTRHLSVSKKFDQAKFRIDLRNGRYELSTKAGPVDITEFIDSEPLVCPRNEFA
jgi:hypothetical protein